MFYSYSATQVIIYSIFFGTYPPAFEPSTGLAGRLPELWASKWDMAIPR